MKKSLNCGGHLLSIESPLVMGILNVTQDSFYDGGKLSTDEAIIKKTQAMLSEGASIIDVGACSTRPGSIPVSEKAEIEKISNIVTLLKQEFPDIILSIDTYRASVANTALEKGAGIINDISAGDFDSEMINVIKHFNCPYIIMHMQGIPETMQKEPVYKNVTKEVLNYLVKKVELLLNSNIHDIIIDPGFGFGKNQFHNFRLLKDLDLFHMFNFPVLAGVSRKSMINKTLGTKPDTALNGTTIANTLALLNGADILRVHDVREAMEAVKMVKYYQSIKETDYIA